MLRALIVVVLALFLGSCTTTGAEKIAAIPAGKRFSVVSLMGKDAYIAYVGLTIFENKHILRDTSEWEIDKFVIKEISRSIEKSGRFSYVPSTYDGVLLSSLGPQYIPLTGSLLLEDMKPYLRKVQAESGADIILLVTSRATSDFVFGTGEQLRNYGVYRRNVIGIKKTAVFCNMDVIVVDGVDFSVIGRLHTEKFDIIDNKYWSEPIGAFSKQQLSALELAIENLIQLQLENAITKLGL